MIRIEKEANVTKILEALLNGLSSRKVLGPSTIQSIVSEERSNVTAPPLL
jgi:hypothetical protein